MLKKNFLKPVIATALLLIVMAAMFFVYSKTMPNPVNDNKAEVAANNSDSQTAADDTKGSKEVKIEVVIPGEDSKEFTLNTDADYLRQALDENKLIEGKDSSYGFYITTVNGRTADDGKQEWWCITKSGETINYGVDQIPVADGDQYELTLKTGY